MVAEAATAVEAEPVTAPVEIEAPPSEETQPPETATVEGSETAAPPASETEAPDPLAGIAPEVMLNHPAVRDHIARETESVRRRSERVTEERVQQARSDWVVSGRAFTEVQAALEAGDNPRAQQIINATLANRDWAAVTTVDRIGRAKLPEGKIAADDIDRLDRALDAARRGTGTLDEYADTLIEVRAKAYAENVLAPQIEQRLTREAQARARAAAKTAQAKAAEATSTSQGRPTLGVPGSGAATTGITPEELERMPTEVFRAKPPAEQERLIQEARTNAARVPAR